MSEIPEPVHALAMRLAVVTDRPSKDIVLRQRGRMRNGKSARWMRFKAQQLIESRRCQFKWKATVGLAGLVSVTDALSATGGLLEAKLFGVIKVAHAQGEDATKGELMRYLAELPWCPDAIVHNKALEWQGTTSGLAVSAQLGSVRATVFLDLDDQGRIATIHAPDRPFATGKTFVPAAWWGEFFDYRQHRGRMLPFRGRVGWEHDGERIIYWEGEIVSWMPADCSAD